MTCGVSRLTTKASARASTKYQGQPSDIAGGIFGSLAELTQHRPTVRELDTSKQLVVCRMQDQLIIFMALASGRSRMSCGEPTLHTRTAMTVAERLTGARFTVKPPKDDMQHWMLECVGAGFAA